MTDCIRKDFEDWYTEGNPGCPSIERNLSGGYKLMQAHAGWVVWEAAAKKYTTTVPMLSEALNVAKQELIRHQKELTGYNTHRADDVARKLVLIDRALVKAGEGKS